MTERRAQRAERRYVREIDTRSSAQWAEAKISLPTSNAKPGPLNLYPYQVSILNSADNRDVQRVSAMMCSQIGKSLVVVVVIGRTIDARPQPIMLIQPTEKDLKRFIRDKLTPMFYNFSHKIELSKTGQVPLDGLAFRGGYLTFGHAYSPTSLRSVSARIVLMDEIDLYGSSVDSANPVDIIMQRTATFDDQITAISTSTPTLKGFSNIDAQMGIGLRFEYIMPCYHCGYKEYWQLEHFDPDDAILRCSNCSEAIVEDMRQAMIRRGSCEHVSGDDVYAHCYHLNQFANPLVSLQRTAIMVKEYTEHGLTTQVLAEPYELEEGAKLDPNLLQHLFVNAITISDSQVRTIGVDVQKDRIEASFIAWDGITSKAYVHSHHRITRTGTSLIPAFRELKTKLPPRMWDKMFVDRGFEYEEIRQALQTVFPLEMRSQKVQLCLGKGKTFDEPIFARENLRFATISTNEAKSYTHQMLADGDIDILRSTVPADYLIQLTSEHLTAVPGPNGTSKLVWDLIKPGMRNEALDCFVMALAARWALGPDYRRRTSLLPFDLNRLEVEVA